MLGVTHRAVDHGVDALCRDLLEEHRLELSAPVVQLVHRCRIEDAAAMGESAVPGDPAGAVEDHAGGRRGGTEELRELPARFSVELQELLLLLSEAVSR